MDMARILGVGIIGCGNISTSYLKLAPLFRGIEVRACADINPEAASARATEYGIRAESVEDLLAADDIDMIVNLTVPAVHYAVSAQGARCGQACLFGKALRALGCRGPRSCGESREERASGWFCP
jgi:predicted dehydrogenase